MAAVLGSFGQKPNLYEKETILKNIKIDPISNCWLWSSSLNQSGYGKLSIQKKHWIAHRASWKIFNGDFDKSLLVLHKCDVRSCVNPSHLFLGTPQDNMTDMVKKGRSATGMNNGSKKYPERLIRGSLSHAAKLNEENVFKIKNLLKKNIKQKEIAKMFGVDIRTISVINTGKAWKHVVVDKDGGGLF